MQTLVRIAVLMLALLQVSQAAAAIIPGFSTRGCSNRASHIIVAELGAGEDATRVNVVESWRGDLEPGDTICLPEFAELVGYVASGDLSDIAWDGHQVIMFLIKSELPVAEEEQPDADDPARTRWLPAGGFHFRPIFAGRTLEFEPNAFNLRISIAWIDDEKVYAYIQAINPGPLVPFELYQDTDSLREAVDRHADSFSEFRRAATIASPVERAEGLLPFLESEEHRDREQAYMTLAQCGGPAIPIMLAILADEEKASHHYLAVAALVVAGREQVGSDLASLLATEFAFWRELDHSIVRGKGWNRWPVGLRQRHVLLEQILIGLSKTRHAPASERVTELRTYWIESRLGRNASVGTIDTLCAEYIRRIDNDNGPGE